MYRIASSKRPGELSKLQFFMFSCHPVMKIKKIPVILECSSLSFSFFFPRYSDFMYMFYCSDS